MSDQKLNGGGCTSGREVAVTDVAVGVVDGRCVAKEVGVNAGAGVVLSGSSGKLPEGREFSSLYSMFYLNYNQYTIKAAQFRGNGHQYHQLGAAADRILKEESAQVSLSGKQRCLITLLEIDYSVT